MRLKRAKLQNPEVNMVPMIDCVFQLIIFFLISMQVKKNEVTALQLPVARNAEDVKKTPKPPLIVNILAPTFRDAEGRAIPRARPYICLANEFDIREFKDFMQRQKRFYANQKEEMPIVRIRADAESEFQQIQDCLVACRDAGIWQVRLTTKKGDIDPFQRK